MADRLRRSAVRCGLQNTVTAQGKDMPLRHEEVTQRIIGCAIAVHKGLGPGLLESAYEAALTIEFDEAHVNFDRQVQIAATYRNKVVGHYRPDFIVEQLVVVEVKAVDRLDPVFDSQMLTYLRASGLRVGLLLNFNVHLVSPGLRRFVL